MSFLHSSSSLQQRAMLKALVSLCMCVGLAAHCITVAAQPASKGLLGRWDLTLTSPTGELPSWIEISEDQGHPKIVMVGVTDHANALRTVAVNSDRLQFVSPKNEEGFSTDMVFKGKLEGDQLLGSVTGPSGVVWQWKGERALRLRRSRPPHWGKPLLLFNGKDLTGWATRTQSKESAWRAEGGTLVKDGNGPDLVTTAKFNDFKLHIEFNCGANANSGVFLRGRYEVQVESESAAEPNSHHTGGVYGFLDPTPEQPRRPGVWQSFDIILVGRNVTVVQNGITVIDHKNIPGITGGALDSHESLPGPIYLQASEVGKVAYRNIVITPAGE